MIFSLKVGMQTSRKGLQTQTVGLANSVDAEDGR
jgi:hypothetical protein